MYSVALFQVQQHQVLRAGCGFAIAMRVWVFVLNLTLVKRTIQKAVIALSITIK